jgi:hypothetical protein
MLDYLRARNAVDAKTSRETTDTQHAVDASY